MEEPFGHSPRPRRPIINITPLVDVMLLLLIFFMVTSTFRDMRALDLQLPEAVSGEAQPRDLHEITVMQDGALSFNGMSMDHEELRTALRDTLAHDAGARIVLRADKRTPYAHVVHVLDLARGEGVGHLILPVIPAE